MNFTSYTDASVSLMVELVNTHDLKREPPEQLRTAADVTAFLRRHRMLGENTVSDTDVEEIRELRDEIRGVFTATDDDLALDRLNAVLAAAGVVPRIARIPDGSRELFFAPADAPLARRVACDAGIGLAMMLTEHAARLKSCAADPCRNVFVDLSRNRSRRWCSESCAARVNVAAYRARRAAPPVRSE